MTSEQPATPPDNRRIHLDRATALLEEAYGDFIIVIPAKPGGFIISSGMHRSYFRAVLEDVLDGLQRANEVALQREMLRRSEELEGPEDGDAPA